MHLTPRQREIFLYIRNYIRKKDLSPTYDDIRRKFGFRSFNAVFKHLKQLEEKGVITNQLHKKRAIALVEHGPPSAALGLLGTVAAGEPIEAIEERETIAVPREFLGSGENFCLKVKGESMIDDGVHDGDIVVVNKRPEARSGEMVVALINNEATLKRFNKIKGGVELRPANPAMRPIRVVSGDFKVLGVVTGLLRKY